MNASSRTDRYRLKTMFLALTVCGLLVAYVLQRARVAEQQYADVRHLRSYGIGCVYDYEVEHSPLDRRHPWRERRFYPLDEEERQVLLRWPREMLGDDFFDKVIMASVNRTPLNPSGLDAYRRLRHVHMLSANVDQDDRLQEIVQRRKLTSLVVGPNHERWRNQQVSIGCLEGIVRQQVQLSELRLLIGFERPMTVELWDAISNLSCLEHLTLHAWDVSEQPFDGLAKLNVCALECCRLPIEFDIRCLDQLRGLSIEGCEVDNSWLENAKLPNQIAALNIRRTKITTHGLRLMKDHQLKHVAMSASQVHPRSGEDLAKLPSLQSIALSGGDETERKTAKQLLASALPKIRID